MMFEVIQYRAKPLGKDRVKKPSIRGIIQSIMRLVDACRSSMAGMVVIFCWAQVVAATRMGMMKGVGSGFARSSHRNLLSNGTVPCTGDSHA